MRWGILNIAVVVGFGLMPVLSAQVILLSENRSVSVSGVANAFGSDAPGTVYSLSNLPSAPFSSFVSSLSSNVTSFSPGTGPNGLDVSAEAGSRAFQNSTISSSQFSVSADVTSESSSLLPTWPGLARSEARSLFEVSFSVPTPQTYQLTLDRFQFVHGFSSLEAGCTLAPLGADPILDLPLSTLSNGQTFSGVLEADTIYTLSMVLQAVSTHPDPLGELGTVHADLTFTVVPEPSTLLLLGLALSTLGIRKLLNTI